MMKEKLFYLLPLLALASCGEPSYKDASLHIEITGYLSRKSGFPCI